MKKHCSIVIGFLFVLLIGAASADPETVYYNNIGGGNLKANGQPLGHDCFVELGAFTVGFEPNSGNRASWKANWFPLGRAAYDAQSQEFDGVVQLSNNNLPFTTANKAWVWVFDSSGNWALFSNASWKWPNTTPPPGPGSPYQLNCTPATATIVVAGSTSASNPQITCELVTDVAGPGITFPQWAELKLPEGFRTKAEDFDGDGQSNLMEYALGTNATDRNNFSTAVQVRDYSGQSYLSAKVNKGFTTGVTYTVQWSNTLTGWQTTGLNTLVNNAVLLEVRDPGILGTDPKRFMRVHINCPD